MPTATGTMVNGFGSSDAALQSFLTAIDAAMVAAGIVQTADSGQFNPATIVRPTVVNTVAGYRMYRFADTLQATKPVYIKMIVRTGGNSATWPAIYFMVGTGSDGAGNLTGQVSADNGATYNPSNDAAGDTHRWRMSASPGHFVLNFGPEVTNGDTRNCHYCIERVRGDDGTEASGPGIFLGQKFGGNSPRRQIITWSGAVPAQLTGAGWDCLAPEGTTALFGVDVGVFPVGPAAGRLFPPITGFIVYKNPDIAHDTDIPVTLYGVQRNYRCNNYVGSNIAVAQGNGQNLTYTRLAHRYD